MNGVCVIWKGWIDCSRLDGTGCLEFDEDKALVCIDFDESSSFPRVSPPVYLCWHRSLPDYLVDDAIVQKVKTEQQWDTGTAMKLNSSCCSVNAGMDMASMDRVWSQLLFGCPARFYLLLVLQG